MELKGWMGLIVGPILGGLMYVKAMRRSDEELQVGLLLLFLGLGLAAGGVMWLIDVMRSKKK